MGAMTDLPDETFGSWDDWDTFHLAYEKFNEGCHTLVLWPLHAAINHLKEEAEAEDAKLEPRLSSATGGEREWLGEQQQRNWQYFDDQERFLRNMALIGLLSRLIHTLRDMARSSEWMVPRRKRYGGGGELAELWEEFKVRFQLEFSAYQEHIDYLDRLRMVRNQIVHDGGEANPPKPFAESGIRPDGTIDMYDTSFSEKYPEFVEGNDFSAEVVVRQEQLDRGIECSIEIVKWVSEQLRAKEVETERGPNLHRRAPSPSGPDRGGE